MHSLLFLFLFLNYSSFFYKLLFLQLYIISIIYIISINVISIILQLYVISINAIRKFCKISILRKHISSLSAIIFNELWWNIHPQQSRGYCSRHCLGGSLPIMLTFPVDENNNDSMWMHYKFSMNNTFPFGLAKNAFIIKLTNFFYLSQKRDKIFILILDKIRRPSSLISVLFFTDHSILSQLSSWCHMFGLLKCAWQYWIMHDVTDVCNQSEFLRHIYKKRKTNCSYFCSYVLIQTFNNSSK